MEWAVPEYRRGEVDWAGRQLAIAGASEDFTFYISEDWSRAIRIISNWRSSHSYPLNTFQVTLRRKGRVIDSKCIVAQRIKRLWSINHKLERFQSMQLSQMQDIGGCRAIMESAAAVNGLVDVYRTGNLNHKLYKVTDYIAEPRTSGYRGVHLLWQYMSNKNKTTYNGLRVEMQIRSALQHAWATAVETVGVLTSQALKSSLGEEDWLRFFALMGSVIARREACKGVPNTPDDYDLLIAELRLQEQRLNAVNLLSTFGHALNQLNQDGAQSAHFFLLQLDPVKKQVSVTGFKQSESDLAERRYLETEEKHDKGTIGTIMSVLVSVDNISALRSAYPNYFLDTRIFVSVVKEALGQGSE